ncbi:hypothetical protein FB45DRAFT_872147 [Roridomyces roridus]|uniref:Uncharacterized protein n=1 Tax=Roridomyces roridus TaxID=1738132 RepID=A0AAD7BEM8_9AGAR|nr:hypothetical protein FB45DRAFT_872147 [Roridomyces roridus]
MNAPRSARRAAAHLVLRFVCVWNWNSMLGQPQIFGGGGGAAEGSTSRTADLQVVGRWPKAAHDEHMPGSECGINQRKMRRTGEIQEGAGYRRSQTTPNFETSEVDRDFGASMIQRAFEQIPGYEIRSTILTPRSQLYRTHLERRGILQLWNYCMRKLVGPCPDLAKVNSHVGRDPYRKY